MQPVSVCEGDNRSSDSGGCRFPSQYVSRYLKENVHTWRALIYDLYLIHLFCVQPFFLQEISKYKQNLN